MATDNKNAPKQSLQANWGHIAYMLNDLLLIDGNALVYWPESKIPKPVKVTAQATVEFSVNGNSCSMIVSRVSQKMAKRVVIITDKGEVNWLDNLTISPEDRLVHRIVNDISKRATFRQGKNEFVRSSIPFLLSISNFTNFVVSTIPDIKYDTPDEFTKMSNDTALVKIISDNTPKGAKGPQKAKPKGKNKPKADKPVADKKPAPVVTSKKRLYNELLGKIFKGLTEYVKSEKIELEGIHIDKAKSLLVEKASELVEEFTVGDTYEEVSLPVVRGHAIRWLWEEKNPNAPEELSKSKKVKKKKVPKDAIDPLQQNTDAESVPADQGDAEDSEIADGAAIAEVSDEAVDVVADDASAVAESEEADVAEDEVSDSDEATEAKTDCPITNEIAEINAANGIGNSDVEVEGQAPETEEVKDSAEA